MIGPTIASVAILNPSILGEYIGLIKTTRHPKEITGSRTTFPPILLPLHHVSS